MSKDAGVAQDLEAARAAFAVAQGAADALDAQIASAKISVDTARANLGYTRIVSPINGIVIAVLASLGQTVNANQSTPNIVKIANLDEVTIKAQISEADVVKVKAGQPAHFTILGEPEHKYTSILREVERARSGVASMRVARDGRKHAHQLLSRTGPDGIRR